MNIYDNITFIFNGALMALSVIAVVIYGIFYLRALRPKEGTLEWISRLEKSGFHKPKSGGVFSKWDWSWLVLVAGITFAIWTFAYRHSLEVMLIPENPAFDLQSRMHLIVQCFIFPMIGNCCCFALLQKITKSTGLALLCSAMLLWQVNVYGHSASHAVASSSMLALWLFIIGNQSVRSRVTYLMICGGILGFGFYLSGSALVLVIVALILLIIYGELGRAKREKWARTWDIITFLVSFILVTWVIYLPAAMHRGMNLSTALFSLDYYVFVYQRISQSFGQMGVPFWLLLTPSLPLQFMLFLAGGLTGITAIIGAIRFRSSEAIFIAAMVLGAAVSTFFGWNWTVFACVLSIGYSFSVLLQRGKGKMVIVSAAVLLALAGFIDLFWFLW